MDNVLLSRMDKNDRIGGNKIPRFISLFDKVDKIIKIVCMSNRGSHSFYTLSELSKQDNRLKNTNLLFLELGGREDPYSYNSFIGIIRKISIK